MWIGENLRMVHMALRFLNIPLFNLQKRQTQRKKTKSKKCKVQKCKRNKSQEHFAFSSTVVCGKYAGKNIFASTALVLNMCV